MAARLTCPDRPISQIGSRWLTEAAELVKSALGRTHLRNSPLNAPLVGEVQAAINSITAGGGLTHGYGDKSATRRDWLPGREARTFAWSHRGIRPTVLLAPAHPSPVRLKPQSALGVLTIVGIPLSQKHTLLQSARGSERQRCCTAAAAVHPSLASVT